MTWRTRTFVVQTAAPNEANRAERSQSRRAKPIAPNEANGKMGNSPNEANRAERATVLVSGVLGCRFQRKTPETNTVALGSANIQSQWSARGFT
jgi:hypothetical protein